MRTALIAAVIASPFLAQTNLSAQSRDPRNTRSPQEVAPIPINQEREQRRRGTPTAPPEEGEVDFPSEVRTIDGTENNPQNPEWGATQIEFIRLTTVGYADGVNEPSGGDRPSARAVSNACAVQTESIVNDSGATDYLWQWGQFLDHDITETPGSDPAEAFNIAVPAGDIYFDPTVTGTAEIGLNRSFYHEVDGVRQQVNEITAYIDASNVYGSSAERAEALRAMDGTGKLKTSDGNLLPFNEDGLANAEIPNGSTYFLAGDVRANEQVGLIAMHTLFMREHNHWAETLAEADPSLSGDELYEMARVIVGAEMQAITYREFLPVLLGRNALPPYRGFNARVNPGISNIFATAAYRVGHTMLSTDLLRLDANGDSIGDLSLAEAFFTPNEVVENGIDEVLRGLAAQPCQEIDGKVIDDIRNFLFGAPGSGGFDLASLNIQRGRDHGLPGFNQVRVDFGLRPYRGFRDISRDRSITDELSSIYDSVNQIDPWIGLLSEDHVRGAMVGETLQVILSDQFQRLRDGDRFWYENHLSESLVNLVEEQTLATIIRRNTEIDTELQDNVFITE
ncbi:MAG: peroxidase family protein [Opitutaceae bacterium]